VIEIDSILNAQLMPEQDVNILDSALVKTARIAYVIFTSGTSGKPKAVTVSHSHFLQYLQSSVHVDAFRPSDIIAQVSSCTWDVHLHEILGSLLVGGSVVLLRPDQSNRNMDYLARIVEQQQVTAICVVPTLLAILFDTVQAQQTLHRLRTVRLFWSTGKCKRRCHLTLL
jgi:acyl-coenzyme A synthetase/AMP-(fatty) acid ligase